MATTLCTSGAVKLKAGSEVSTSLTDSDYTQLINQAESHINVIIKQDGVDIIDEYSNLDVNTKKILEDAASSHAAISAIAFDMSNYITNVAQTLLNVNYARFTDAISLLRDKKYTDFMRDGGLSP